MAEQGEPSNFDYGESDFYGSPLEIQSTIALATRNVAVVELYCQVGGVEFKVKADARRNPEDRSDSNVGIGLAMGIKEVSEESR